MARNNLCEVNLDDICFSSEEIHSLKNIRGSLYFEKLVKFLRVCSKKLSWVIFLHCLSKK